MATVVISDRDNPNWQFRAATSSDILRTSPMGDCWALIVVNTDHSRLLAHVPAGDGGQLNGGGLDAINGHIQAGATARIVRGKSNQNESAVMTEAKYRSLEGLAIAATAAQTIAGYFYYAQVDATGTITYYDDLPAPADQGAACSCIIL